MAVVCFRFPKAPERTRKWLHLDDLTGAVFRHQMNMVRLGMWVGVEGGVRGYCRHEDQ
jgi:hypothetical protein